MAILIPQIARVEGLEFVKLLGSGGGNGFAMYPHWGRYVLMAVWKNQSCQEDFFKKNKSLLDYFSRAENVTTYTLKNTMAHGLWGGVNPFVSDKKHNDSNKIAVITRATIKWSDMVRFWREVPDASKNMDRFPGCELAVGVGELPFRYQATFSIWTDAHKMRDFAYKSKQHTEMIDKTRKIGWYKEELFARFEVLSIDEKL